MSRTDAFHVGSSPVASVQRGEASFRARSGLVTPSQPDYSRVSMPQSQSRQVADAYDRMPSFDPRAVPAYKAMAEEVGRQFDHVTRPVAKGGMGLDVSVHKEDPYGEDGWTSINHRFRNDVVQHNQIKVLSTGSTGGHPVFTNDQNDMFRAVHDVFGHLGSGRGIDAHGEEAAFQKHATMFSPLARQAMATETRGQNAALHKHGDFQEQKVGLLPAHMQSAQFANQGNWADRLAAASDARIEHAKQGF